MTPMHIALDGAVDPAALKAELAAVLGPQSSTTWYLVGMPGRAVVTFFPSIQFTQVDEVMQAHVAPQAVALRELKARPLPSPIVNGGDARQDRLVRRLVKVNPTEALLEKEGLK